MSNETSNDIATVLPVDRDALQSNGKFRRSGSIVKEFGLNTSTHGIPGIARSQSIHNRFFWSTSLLIFAGVMIYFIIQSITAYFQYPSQTSVSIIVEWPQAFPAVTICNYSPLRYDRFLDPFLNYTNTFHRINNTDETNLTKEQSLYIHEFLLYKLNRNESLTDLFYSLETMLITCSYNGISCTATNFTWFISSSYGLCYTFNAKLKDTFNSTVRSNSDNGAFGLFQLTLYVHQHQYVPFLSNGIGMVALVHDNTQLPNIEMSGMLLAPGEHHKLGYSKKTSLFLPSPYTTCNNQVNRGMQIMFNEYHHTNYSYSQLDCFFAAIQSYTYEKCGCGNPFRWSARSVVLPHTEKSIPIVLCDIENPCYTPAASEFMNTKSIWTVYASDCTQECTYSDFIIKSTSLLAPPTFLFNDIKQFVQRSTIPLPRNWSTSWESEIRSSYVSLEVTYETLRTEIYSQQATISPVDVLSNVGGQTGLWIGISFLSLMEVAEMIYRLLRSQSYRLYNTLRKKDHGQTTTVGYHL